MTEVAALFAVRAIELQKKLKRLAVEAVSDPHESAFALLVVPEEHAVLARLLFPGEVSATDFGFVAISEHVQEAVDRLASESEIVASFLPLLWVWTIDEIEFALIVDILGPPVMIAD